MDEYLLGLDVGTSSMCCVLTDTSLRPISIAHTPMTYYKPPNSSSITWEFEGKALVAAAGDLVAKTLHQHGASSRDVSGLGITSQRQAVVLLDSEREPLLCSPNFDMRGVFQGAAVDDLNGDQVYNLTGHFPAFVLASSRIQWLHDARPDLYNRIDTVLPLASWLGCELTGARASEPAIDAEAGLLDVPLRSRSSRLEEALGLESSWLPPLCPAGAMLGGVKAPIGEKWGLAKGTPVAIAGPDTQCALLSLGTIEVGQQIAALGWSGTLQQVTATPHFDPDKRTWAGLHCFEGKWVTEANMGDLGQAYRWLKDLALGIEVAPGTADAMASEVEPGAEGVMVKLGGGHETAPKAGLTTGGLTIPVPLTFQKASPAHIMRAALESIAFTIKANRSTLQEVAGPHHEIIHAAGGMASSSVLMQILADVARTPVQCSSFPESTARGAAAAGAVAARLFGSLPEVVDNRDDPTVTYYPDLPTSAEYEFHYERWLRMAESMCSIR